jgi:L-alanine-DL-glutamate epimerase-like enolase superfamily enzyme
MRITRIETFPVSIPLKPERRMVSALGEHTVSQYVLVRISTDVGLEGAGEATVLPRWSGETVWGAQALIDRVLAPRLIGTDPTDIDGVAALMDEAAEDNWFAKSALEMACWDICGKDFGKPVYELLGGPARPTALRCRFSMGAYDPETAARRALELIAAGFDTIKVKVGTEVAADIERVRAVRKAIGPGPALVIDANCGYDAPTAIAMAREIEDCDVALFEQPTPRGDFEALAEVRRAIRPQVMADDICFDFADAVECVRHRACDVISVYPGKNGGLAKSKRIVDYAGLHGIACTIGSNLELDIASAAMCHLVVACRNLNVEKYPGDIMGPDYHAVSVVKEPLEIRGPLISISDRPGLGIEVDWKAVEAHPCK